MALPFQLVSAVSETAVFLPVTGWMAAGPVERLRVVREVRARTGTLEVTLGYETADVANDPNAAAAIGTYLSANGLTYPQQFADVSSATESAQLIRFGWMVRNASGGGTALSTGFVGGVVEIEACGG